MFNSAAPPSAGYESQPQETRNFHSWVRRVNGFQSKQNNLGTGNGDVMIGLFLRQFYKEGSHDDEKLLANENSLTLSLKAPFVLDIIEC